MNRRRAAGWLLVAACDTASPSPCRSGADCGEAARCRIGGEATEGRCVEVVEVGEADPPLRVFAGVAAPDVVFVVDDGPTMAEPQRRLVAAAEAFARQSAWQGNAPRIAVTTTSVDNPICAAPASARHGRFAASSCLDRLDDFVGPDGMDARSLCTDVCHFDSVALGLDRHPWIEAAELPPEVPLADALACLLPQGISGCLHGAPLEAMHLAQRRMVEPGDDAYGFVRRWSVTWVVVTDGVDCSATPEAGPVFDPAGDRAWWPNPAADTAPPAVCLAAGTDCAPTFDGWACVPVDRDLDGAIASADDDTVLHPLARYEGVGDPSQRILIAGVPVDAPQAPVYARTRESAFTAVHGLDPGCDDGIVAAPPPVRLDDTWVTLASVCADDWSPVMARAARSDGSRPVCIPRCQADAVRVTWEAAGVTAVPVPACVGPSPYVRPPEDAPACTLLRDNPLCDADETELVLRVAADAPRGAFLVRPNLRLTPSDGSGCPTPPGE